MNPMLQFSTPWKLQKTVRKVLGLQYGTYGIVTLAPDGLSA